MSVQTEALRCPVCDHREVAPVGARCPRDGGVLVVDEGPADPLVGRTLEGRFVIVGLLGRGRAGRIYRAIVLATGREVALRVLRPALARGTGLAERLAAAAPRLAAIDHPGVVVPFATWTSGNLHCQATEKVRGAALESLFGTDPRRWVLVTAEILATLAAAARKGVCHLHLTPQKVRVVELPDGGLLPRVLDFGLSEVDLSVWQALGVLSPLARRFMAPEMDETGGDARADVYAVGQLLWWVMTDGRLDDPERRKGCPPGLAAVAGRATADDPAERYPDADAMRRALLTLLRTPEALWRSPGADAEGHGGLRVACTACAWSLHGPGPRFDAALERLVTRLEAQGDLDPGRSRVFRRLVARSDVLLCDTPDSPPHVARVCPACGSAHSVRLTAVGAMAHCVTCGYRLPDSKLEAVVTQRPARPGPAAFSPADGALLIEEGSISARLEAGPLGVPLPRRPAAFHFAGNLDTPLRVTVSPRHPPALPAGFVYCGPLDGPPVPDRHPRPLVEPGHVAEVELRGWPPPLDAPEGTRFGVVFEGRGARRVLRAFTIRPLPRVKVSLAFEGESPRELGPSLLTVARGAPFSLTVMADATLPPLEAIEIILDGRDEQWRVPLELRSAERKQTGVLPRIPAGPALSFGGLVPRDLPVGRDVRVTLTARFQRTLGHLILLGRWRITALSASGTEVPTPTLEMGIGGQPPVPMAPDRAVLVELLGGIERAVDLEVRARDLPAGCDLSLRAEGASVDERLTCTHREGSLSIWRARVTFGSEGPGPLTVFLEIGRSRIAWPVTVVAPPRVQATVLWDARDDLPFVHLLGPDRPLVAARPWPGARQARVHLRAVGYPVDVEVIDAPDGRPPTDLGALRLDPETHQVLTLDIGGELRLRVAGVAGGEPAVYVVRIAAPVALQPLQLVEGDVVAIDRVVAGHVETRVLHVSNALPEPLGLAAVETEGIGWMQIVRAEAAGGGPITSLAPQRLDPSGLTPLILHIAPPAALPASDEPIEGTLLLWVPGLAAPVRVPVGVREVVAVETLPGPLALDLGALRIVARVATPDGPQTWRGRLGIDEMGVADPAQGVRAIAHRLSRGLGMRPRAIHLVCPTGSPFSERQQLAVLLTESFGGVEVDITLDQATASALGALEAQIKDDPDYATQELLSVDIGARTTDVARIQAAMGADGRWQVWVRSRASSRQAGDAFTALLVGGVMRPAVAEALSALAGHGGKRGAWYTRAQSGRRRTGKVGGWYARARTGARQMELAEAADHPGDLRVARSDRAAHRIAEGVKRAFGENETVRLDTIDTFQGALDDLLVSTPRGLEALTPEARTRLGEVELSRAAYAPLVKQALDDLFGRIGGLIADGGVQRVVLCGYSVHLPACLEAAQTAFSGQHLRIVPESLAARGAFWTASGKAGVRWVGEPIDLDG